MERNRIERTVMFLLMRNYLRANVNVLLRKTATFPIPLLELCLREPEEGVRIQNFAEVVVPSYSISTFKSHFRMTPVAFEAVYSLLAPCPELTLRDPIYGGRNQVGVEKTLLVALWALANKESYRSIGDRFDVAKSTVFYCINRVVNALLNNLCQRTIIWPPDENRQAIAHKFAQYGLENCIGAVDGCHIEIDAPMEAPVDYINRNNYHSVVLQVVCDADLFFTDCDVRWPGSVHDSRVLRNSDLYHNSHLMFNPGQYIIGDAAYPCLPWLMPPFKNNGRLTDRQRLYNTHLSKTRSAVERSLALLKGRFRRLKHLMMHSIEHIHQTIIGCCVLHNICLQHDADVEEYIRENMNEEVPNIPYVGFDHLANGRQEREAIVQHLWARYHR